VEKYFNGNDAVVLYSDKIETTLELIANRYINANPKLDYTARPYLLGEIIRNRDYRYTADFSSIFPNAPCFSYVYAWGKYHAGEDGDLRFILIPKGPVKIWMNQAEAYATDAAAERYEQTPVTIYLPVKKGWNHIVLRFTRTKTGFGGEFGTWLGKLDYYFFRGAERPDGLLLEGFDYTPPLGETLKDLSPENLSAMCLPPRDWTDEEKKSGVFTRIFKDAVKGESAAAVTQINISSPALCRFSGKHSGNCTFYIDGKFIFSSKEAGHYQFEKTLDKNRVLLTVISEKPDNEVFWDFNLNVLCASANTEENNSIYFTNPFFNTKTFPWIFAGLFKKTPINVHTEVFDRELLIGEKDEKTYWRLDMPDTWVRLYNENPLYGHWNYPLGVTLYGLIETARLFTRNGINSGADIGSYVRSHVEKSTRTFDYALFDKEHFGGATAVHHLLTSIDSLDDCGSFGSLVLEAACGMESNKGTATGEDFASGAEGLKNLPPDFRVTVEYTANHILNRQDRLKEGCFYRRRLMHHFHNDTLWADDLYMSVPFLCRYAKYTNDMSILGIAAVQFEGFKKYLFMEEKNLMAHVFDLKRNMNTGIPWGRGNGWTIFSLTELLMTLPENHPRREFLLDFFRRHSAGCLDCQDENGMWHQVLDMPSSYIETSCTAIFICAFCRGIRYNWFEGDTAIYRIAVEKAWHALETYSIDRGGNVYGVCRGSEFSFNPKYYAQHLLPRLNDTHGIGIVLLAGVELQKLRDMN